MINEQWRQIAGFAIQDNGEMGIVWMSVDPEWDVVRVHHTATFKREVLAIIAGELNRKKWIPIAWENEEFSNALLNDHGCNMLYDRSLDTPEAAERLTNEMNERMRGDRFKVGPGGDAWLKESKSYNRQNAKIPRETHPLMAATRHAIDQLTYARTEKSVNGSTQKMYPKVAIV